MRELQIPMDASVMDALCAIQSGGVGLCLMTSPDRKFLGVLTDGDIRRALIGGTELQDSVIDLVSTSPVTVTPHEDRAAVLELMQARNIDAVPIVDRGQLAGLHTLQEILGVIERPNWVVIMAGGRGTRLGSLTADLPKPMLSVAGRPILERILLHVLTSGFRKIAISVNYKADAIISHFGDGRDFGCEIVYLHEQQSTPLGTVGCLTLLEESGVVTPDPLLILNGDVITPEPLGSIVDAHVANESALTIGATIHNYVVPFGVLLTDSVSKLIGIMEKPAESWLVGAGINVVEPSLIGLIPHGQRFDMTDLYSAALDGDSGVAVHNLGTSWIDVGRPQDLAIARGEIG